MHDILRQILLGYFHLFKPSQEPVLVEPHCIHLMLFLSNNSPLYSEVVREINSYLRTSNSNCRLLFPELPHFLPFLFPTRRFATDEPNEESADQIGRASCRERVCQYV